MVFLDPSNAFGGKPHQLLWIGFDLQSSRHSVFSRFSEMTHKAECAGSQEYNCMTGDHSKIKVSGR